MKHSVTIRQLALIAALAAWMCVSVHAQALGSQQIFAELIDRNQTRCRRPPGIYPAGRGLPRIGPERERSDVGRGPEFSLVVASDRSK